MSMEGAALLVGVDCLVLLGACVFAGVRGHWERLWLLPVSATCLLAMSWGGHLWSFINAPALLLICAGVVAALSVHDPITIGRALWTGWVGEPLSESERRQADAALTTLRSAIYVMALLGALIGFIEAVSAAHDVKRIGPGLAAMLLTPLTAAFVGGVCVSTVRSCLRAQAMVEGGGEAPARVSAGGFQWLIWVLAGVTLLIAAILIDSPLGTFINLPSVLMTATGFGLTLAAYGGRRVVAAIQDGILGAGRSLGSQKGSREILDDLRWSFHLLSGIALVIGLVQMLTSLDDPNAIGPALGVAFLSPLYGVIVGEFIVGTLVRRLDVGGGLGEAGEASAAASAGGAIDV